MKCTKCGGDVSAGDRFCQHCGGAVVESPPEQAAPAHLEPSGSTPRETTRYCMTCGSAVAPDHQHCENCGEGLEPPAAVRPLKTRLADPIEAHYEAVGSAEPPPPPGLKSPPIAELRRGSNRTFYQLLGVAFVFIACAYLGYHYLSSPPKAETRVQEAGLEPTNSNYKPRPPSAGLEPLPRDEYAAQSPSPPSRAVQEMPLRQAGGIAAADGRAQISDEQDVHSQVQPEPPVKEAASVPRSARRSSGSASTPLPYAPPPPVPPPPPRQVTRPPREPASPPLAGVVESPPQPQPRAGPTAALAAEDEKPPQRQSGRVLLPGNQAWQAPPKKKDITAEQAIASASPPRRLQPPPPAPPPQVRQEGIIYWTGKLRKNQTIVVDGAEASVGFVDGALLTGEAVEVHIPSPAVALVERPTPRNGWTRVAFRCLRTTKRSVTLNIQWRLMR